MMSLPNLLQLHLRFGVLILISQLTWAQQWYDSNHERRTLIWVCVLWKADTSDICWIIACWGLLLWPTLAGSRRAHLQCPAITRNSSSFRSIAYKMNSDGCTMKLERLAAKADRHRGVVPVGLVNFSTTPTCTVWTSHQWNTNTLYTFIGEAIRNGKTGSDSDEF